MKEIKVGTRLKVDRSQMGTVFAIRIDSNGNPLIDLMLDDDTYWVARFEEVTLES